MTKKVNNAAILGAGPAGLAVGHELSANDVQVTVLERNDYVGGLCRTIEDSGYRFDLGGHRWFTKNEDLNIWFRRLMEGELVLVDRISRIFYKGKFFYYPIQFGDIVKKTGPITIVHAGFAFLWAALKHAARPQPVITMKQAYTTQFGSKLYEMFFRLYTEKVWGLPCEELSADWVSQRSKGLSIWSLVGNALLNTRKPIASLIDQFMYPRDGFMRIPERMAEDIGKADNDILLDTTVTGITYHGPNDFEVRYKTGTEEKSLRSEAVVSTIPLGVLARILEPKCDEATVEAAKALKFRDLITVNVRLKGDQVTPDTWLYVQDSEILFGRMHEPKNWSPAMVPDADHTSLVLECFCTRGDHIWEMKDEEVAERCIRDLADQLGFIDDKDVVGWQIVRTIQAYPVYDLQYHENMAKVNEFLGRHEGLHMVGRGGSFRYNNSDHSIEMGLLLGRRLLGQDVDYANVNTEAEYQEEIQSTEIGRDSYKVGQDDPDDDSQSKTVANA
jgi:protoporphyrinogen oxidase